MPVKIQELIIQTKIKAGTPDPVPGKNHARINQHEWQHFEKRVYDACLDAMDNWLREHTER